MYLPAIECELEIPYNLLTSIKKMQMYFAQRSSLNIVQKLYDAVLNNCGE